MSNEGLRISTSGSSETTDAIRAHGEIKIRVGVLWLVGIVCGILALGGILAFFFRPDNAKDIWVVIGPLISAGITGVVAVFLTDRSRIPEG